MVDLSWKIQKRHAFLLFSSQGSCSLKVWQVSRSYEYNVISITIKVSQIVLRDWVSHVTWGGECRAEKASWGKEFLSKSERLNGNTSQHRRKFWAKDKVMLWAWAKAPRHETLWCVRGTITFQYQQSIKCKIRWDGGVRVNLSGRQGLLHTGFCLLSQGTWILSWVY